MIVRREDHMTKLGKTKLISVEKHLMSMVVLEFFGEKNILGGFKPDTKNKDKG